MLGKTSKSKLIFLVALVFGGIGAYGQAYLLYHELSNCLPYKVVDFYFYRSIAQNGIYIAPTIAVIGGFVFGLKKFWLATIIPVLSCPLLFAIIFKVASVTHELNVQLETNAGVGDFTQAAAAQNFYSYTVSLTATGLIVGAICSFLLLWLSKSKKMP